MKILIDARMYGTEHTGIGRYTKNLITELLTIDTKNNYLVLLKEPYFSKLDLPKNAQKIHAPYNHYSIEEQIKLPFLLNSLKPNLTHFLHINVPIAYNKPFIVTVHDLIILKQNKEKELLPFYKYLAKKIFFAITVKHAISKSSCIITPSSYVKETIIERFKIKADKIIPIHEGVEKLKGKTVKRSNCKNIKDYFLYVGNAFPHKNLDNLLEALKIVNTNAKEKTLLVIVTKKNKFLNYLKEKIAKLKIDSYVIFKHQIQDDELAFLYKNAIAFIFPSFEEGFGLPGLEALNAGTILCASNIKIFREIYKDKAFYFDPYNKNDIAQKMIKVKDLPFHQKQKMIKAGIVFSNSFDWGKTAKETLEVYKNLYSKLKSR